MDTAYPIIFLIVLIVLMFFFFKNTLRYLRKTIESFGKINKAADQTLTRAKPGGPEWAKQSIRTQMVNLLNPEKLLMDGHLKGGPNPNRDFGGKPCWLRYEQDGFYVDYANGNLCWRIEPMPPSPTMGVCDGNGMIQIHYADKGFWTYDSFGKKKLWEIP